VAKKHLIKDKKGNVVKVLPWPWDEDDSDRPIDDSDDPSGGGGFSGGGGAPPPTLVPGEAIWLFMPAVDLITGAINLNPNNPIGPVSMFGVENNNWCFPNGSCALNLEPNLRCCGCQFPNFNNYPPCGSPTTVSGCPGTFNGGGGSFSGLNYCSWNQIGWPFSTVTIKARIYTETVGQLAHCLNVGSLDVRWNTQSSHYGANHVQPTISGGHGTFSNLQTPTWTQPANPGGGPYSGDAVDFEITHTGMHDSGFPHTPAPNCGYCNEPDPAGNQSIIIEGIFTTGQQMVEILEVIYSTPGGNHTFNPYQNAWTHPPVTTNFPPIQPNNMYRAGINFFYNSLTNTVLYNSPCTSPLTPIFNSWPYGFRTDWEHDPNDPDKTLSTANTLTYPFISGVLNTTTCVHDGMQPIALGAPATVQDLDNEATCNLSGAWPTNPNWYPHMQAKQDANIIHPNQSTFCEWARDWINGGSVPNSFDQRAVAWGYTTQDLENLATDCGCCDTLGVATVPNHDPAGNLLPIAGDSPSGLAPHLGVLADWIHP
jgi:hypothetical protein